MANIDSDFTSAEIGDASRVQHFASVNGVVLHGADEHLSAEELRQRAFTELLRQAAQQVGLLDAGDQGYPDGTLSEFANNAITTLIDKMVVPSEPNAEDCQRYYASHAQAYRIGERVLARHILFATSPGVNIVALRNRAETCLLELRRQHNKDVQHFATAAQQFSNCPSASEGGQLGWLTPTDCAAEFARELFGKSEIGLLPRLLHSRFGFHIVEVLARERGVQQPFQAVHQAIAMLLRQRSFANALCQYLRNLSERATIVGVDLTF